ncbi:MAG: tight adherence protein [Acidimicrobiaceae bacterium]
MRARLKLLALAGAVGVMLMPATAGAAGGVDVHLNEAAKWPDRELTMSLPSKRVLSNRQVVVRENGHPVREAKVTPASTNRKRGVMLVIDTSLTMRGEPIREAMIAARSFTRRRSENTPVGIIFFSGPARVALKPTTDALRLKTALAVGPAVSRGTKIYDAASMGINTLRDAGLTSGAIVVLSDGAEAARGSAISSDALAAEARGADVRIFSVGLSSPSYDPRSLRTMAHTTGGRFAEAKRPKDLPPLFAAIGDRLSAEYLVSYRSVAPAGDPVQIDASVAGFDDTDVISYRAPALSVAGLEPKSVANASNGLDPLRVVLLAIVFFLVVGLVLYFMLRPKQRSLISRVSDFAGVVGLAAPTMADVRRKPERERSARWQRYSEAIQLADIKLTPAALALWTLVGMLVFAWYIAFASGRPPLLFMVLAIPLGVRWYVVRKLAERRRLFEEQLPDNLQVLASALRAGYSFSAGLASMAEDAPEPSRTELQRASNDERLGVDVAEALEAIAKRMDSPEIEYVGIVARMQREAGGNTAEVLDQVIDTIRSRQQLNRMVKVLTTQGRMGGGIITAVPIVCAVGMSILHPGYFDPMFESTLGVILMFAGVVMLTCGWLIIRKIVDVEP